MKQFTLKQLREIARGLNELRVFEAKHANYQQPRDLVQTEIEKLEARASEWVALLEQQLQRLGDSSSTKVIGEVQGAKEDEDIAEEVVTRLEALYCDTWLIEAAYGYGYWDRLLNYNPPWVFKFTRKSATAA